MFKNNNTPGGEQNSPTLQILTRWGRAPWNPGKYVLVASKTKKSLFYFWVKALEEKKLTVSLQVQIATAISTTALVDVESEASTSS